DGRLWSIRPMCTIWTASGRALEQGLHLHRETHVPRDLELAAHEGHLPVQLAGGHVDVVLRGHRHGHVRRRRRPLVDLGLAVLDIHVPLTAVIAAQVELDGRVHALGSVRVELLRHLCENILGGHSETPPLKWWWGLTGLGRLGGRSLSRYGGLAGAAAGAPRPPRATPAGGRSAATAPPTPAPPAGLRGLGAAGAGAAVAPGTAGAALVAASPRPPPAPPAAGRVADPLDAFTRHVVGDAIGPLRDELGAARVVFPFELHPLAVSFVHLAECAGLGRRSLLGVLVHPEYGPWMALRAAILVPFALTHPPPAHRL